MALYIGLAALIWVILFGFWLSAKIDEWFNILDGDEYE